MMRGQSRIRESVTLKSAAACLLITMLASAPGLAQTGYSNAEDLSTGRVIRTLAFTLMVRYGKSVTVEEPVWQWDGDFEIVGPHPEQPSMLVRRVKNRHMELPSWLNPTETTSLNIDVIKRLLEEYRRQNPDDVSYRVEASALGYHVLPVQEHDATGRLVSAKLLLDTVITVPWARRLPSEHLRELARTLTVASGIKVIPFAPNLDALFGANGLRPPKYWQSDEEKAPYGFEWSLDAKTAREALLDLWQRSASSLYWTLLCSPGEGDNRRSQCYLSLGPIPQREVQPDGRVGYKATQFDRVATKPEFLPPPSQRK